MTRTRTKARQTILAGAMAEFAAAVSGASPCNRAAVGCVLTTLDLQVISYGYNGPASGLGNHCMRPEAAGNCGCVHAEQNAVAKAGRPGEPKVAFITMPPCERCASLLVNAGVVLVVVNGIGHRPMREGIENILEPLKIAVVDLSSPSPNFLVRLGAAKARAGAR